MEVWWPETPHLLVPFVDMLSDGREVRNELAEGFHNRRSVWRILEYPPVVVRRHLRRRRKGDVRVLA